MGEAIEKEESGGNTPATGSLPRVPNPCSPQPGDVFERIFSRVKVKSIDEDGDVRAKTSQGENLFFKRYEFAEQFRAPLSWEQQAANAYNGYRDHTGGISLANGHPIPEWEALRPEIQAAWRAAVKASGGAR